MNGDPEPGEPAIVSTEPELPHDSPVVLAHVIAEAIRDLAAGMPVHTHEWVVRGTWRAPETRSPHPRLRPTEATTVVLVMCVECNWPQTIELDGVWTDESLGIGVRPR